MCCRWRRQIEHPQSQNRNAFSNMPAASTYDPHQPPIWLQPGPVMRQRNQYAGSDVNSNAGVAGQLRLYNTFTTPRPRLNDHFNYYN